MRTTITTPSTFVFTVLGLAAAMLLSGCHVHERPNYQVAPWINHMLRGAGAESQEASTFLPGGRTLQQPPTGTIAWTKDGQFMPLHFTCKREEAKTVKLENPFKATDKAAMERGKWGYTTFCQPCHGESGVGDGPVSKKGMPGFPINVGLAPDYSDGHIFHIMTCGRGMMASYASQIDRDDRWKIILHLRELQKAAKGGAK